MGGAQEVDFWGEAAKVEGDGGHVFWGGNADVGVGESLKNSTCWVEEFEGCSGFEAGDDDSARGGVGIDERRMEGGEGDLGDADVGRQRVYLIDIVDERFRQ